MFTMFRATLSVALLLSAMPVLAQSANRSFPSSAVARPGTPIAESKQARACRLHCGSLSASASHAMTPHQSVVERQFRMAECQKRAR